MLVQFKEEFEADPAALYEEQCRWLGIDPGFRPDLEVRHNVGADPRSPRLARAVKRLRSERNPLKRAARRALPRRTYLRLAEAVRLANRVEAATVVEGGGAEAIDAELRRYFEPDARAARRAAGARAAVAARGGRRGEREQRLEELLVDAGRLEARGEGFAHPLGVEAGRLERLRRAPRRPRSGEASAGQGRSRPRRVTSSPTPPTARATTGTPKLSASIIETGTPSEALSERKAGDGAGGVELAHRVVVDPPQQLPARRSAGSSAAAASTRSRSGPSPMWTQCSGRPQARSTAGIASTRLRRLSEEQETTSGGSGRGRG